jgi:hypothetical protein
MYILKRLRHVIVHTQGVRHTMKDVESRYMCSAHYTTHTDGSVNIFCALQNANRWFCEYVLRTTQHIPTVLLIFSGGSVSMFCALYNQFRRFCEYVLCTTQHIPTVLLIFSAHYTTHTDGSVNMFCALHNIYRRFSKCVLHSMQHIPAFQ